MKKILRIAALALAGIYVLSVVIVVVSFFVFDMTEVQRQIARNWISYEETLEVQAAEQERIIEFFSDNLEIMQDIAEQMQEMGEVGIARLNSEIMTWDFDFDSQFLSQLKLYFDEFDYYYMFIFVHEEHDLVEFGLNHMHGSIIRTRMIYSTEYTQDHWSQLEDDWYIYSYLHAPIIRMQPLWLLQPAHSQWILRWLFFGWVWMR